MDVTIDQAGLNRALRFAGRAVPARPALPILHNVVVDAADERLTLTATDSEIGIVTGLAAAVAAPGRAAVPARLLADFVAQLPAEPVRLTVEAGKHRLRAQCGRFTAGFAVADADEFPTIPAPDETTGVDLDARTFKAAIDRVAFAASRDDQRPVLTAALFDGTADGLTVVACDGFRLARAHLPTPAPLGQLLVPGRAAAELGRLLGDADACRLCLTSGGRSLHLRVKDTSLVARLAEGQFPDVNRVIPQEWLTRVTIETATLRQAVGVAGLFGSSNAGRPVRVEARPGALRLKARGDETGDAESELAAAVEGESQIVILSTPLLADVLAACTSRQLELTWLDSRSPVVIREPGQETGPDLWLVMPLHDAALSDQPPAAPAAPPAPAAQTAAPASAVAVRPEDQTERRAA